MLQWILMAVLTAAASIVLLAPLGRRPRAIGGEAEARSIYRDQLEELDRDRAGGLIGEAEAEAARIEIARRLLRTEEAAAGEAATASFGRKAGILVAIVAVPAIAIGTYLLVGAPGQPDRPLAAREDEAAGDRQISDLIERVETHLASNPEDGQGWEVLGPIYMRIGRFDDAVRAFDHSRRLLGATADREALYGEALTRAGAGVVSDEAEAAFRRAVEQDPGNARARFYLAVALGQSGKRDEAVAAWNALIDGAPADALWLPVAQQELAALAEGAAPVRGPTAGDVAAAQEMAPADRQQMIEGMVAGLASRLDEQPDDADGWARLFRAYIVLGRQADAEAALGRARSALAGKPELLAAVERSAAENGLTQEKPTP